MMNPTIKVSPSVNHKNEIEFYLTIRIKGELIYSKFYKSIDSINEMTPILVELCKTSVIQASSIETMLNERIAS